MNQLPAPLRLSSSFAFVGRAAEIATLRTLLPTAPREGRRIALVAGEAGSGKSRLVRELGARAESTGALVLYGTCDAVINTPFEPIAEALDQLVRALDPDELREDLGSTGGELLRILPDLASAVGELSPPLTADADTQRYRLHVAVTNLLAAVSRRRPLLLAVDDLHWADAPTLHLFRHLARAGGDARILLVSTYRDTEVAPRPELAEALADLARVEGLVRLRLDGLTRDEVADFVRQAVDGSVDPQPELAEAVSNLTGGNPFLLCELWRELVETDSLAIESGRLRLVRPPAELGSPDSVREVVGQRLARLAPATRQLLEVAATIGPEFELRVLRPAAALGDAELQPALEQASQSGMIEEVPPLGLAYRFGHELVRKALTDGLPPVRRAELHLRVGEALEHVHAAEPARVLPDLAHHFAAAAPVAGPGRAIEYNVRAARAAAASLAYEDAAERLRVALAIGVDDDHERARIQLELGASLNRGGMTMDALEALHAAATAGRELGDAQLLAQSAIAVEEACWRPGIVDQGAAELLREALVALGEVDAPLRVRLLAGLSRALVLLGEHADAGEVRVAALELARRIDDRPAIAAALMQGYWAPGAATHAEVLEMLDQARELGEQIGDPTIRAEAIAWRVVTRASLGGLRTAYNELDLLRSAAEETRQPFVHYAAATFGSSLALCAGHLAEADAMAERSREWGSMLRGPDASGAYGIQVFNIRREQGRLSELAPIVRLLADRGHSGSTWRPGLAALLAELGMDDAARRELDHVREDRLSELARDALGVAGLTYLADACAMLDDGETAALLYPQLARLAGRPLLVGHLVACFGAADRYPGKLAATLGEWDAAEGHFESALTLNREMGATLWLAHTRYDYARMLLGRRASGDKQRAAALLEQAGNAATTADLGGLAAKIAAVGPVSPRRSRLPDGLSAREVVVLRLVASGMSNREIGRQLVISEHTAANHVRSIFRKTGATNRAEATAYAYRQGLAEA